MQGSNFLGGSFSSRDNVRVPFSLEVKVNHRILKDDIFTKTDPFIFISIAPVLLDQSMKPVEFFQH